MPPRTTNKYVLLGYYIKQHWLSYSLGVIAILATNWIAVSIPEYVRLSIDLLNNDLEPRQDLLWEYMLIMLGLAVVMIFVRTLSRILFFNPGRASLHSALYPSEKKYLYFVARGDGSSEFSKTLSEHNKAVWKYQKIRKNRQAMQRKRKKASSAKL